MTSSLVGSNTQSILLNIMKGIMTALHLLLLNASMIKSTIPPDKTYYSHKIIHEHSSDLPQILVPHVKLGFRHFLFLNSGTPLALEDGNSKNCVA